MLEHHADVLAPLGDLATRAVSCSLSPRAGSRPAAPSTSSRPPSIFSRWLMQRRNVDLPDPDGPTRHITWPGCDREVDAREHLDRPEALVDARRPAPSAQASATAAVSPRRADPHAGDQPLQRPRRRRRGVVPATEAPLQVVLPDHQHARDEQVPDAGHHAAAGSAGTSPGRRCSAPSRCRSVSEMTMTSDVVFSIEIVSLPVGGMITRIACGRTMRRIVSPRPMPSAAAASVWPSSTDRGRPGRSRPCTRPR